MRVFEFRQFIKEDNEFFIFDLSVNPKYWAPKLLDLPIEQWTERKDKKGVQIFESDIVDLHTQYYISGDINDGYSSEQFDCVYRGIVKFVPSKGFVLMKTIRIDDESGDIEYIGRLEYFAASSSFVIGNIHQNQELLK